MNPAAGILVLLAALWLLLAYFDGRLEWLFRLASTTDTSPGAATPATSTAAAAAASNVPARPTTTGARQT